LLARIEALLRRANAMRPRAQTLKAKDLVIDLAGRSAVLNGKPLALRRKEFDLLVLLLQQPGRVPIQELPDRALWKNERLITSNASTPT